MYFAETISTFVKRLMIGSDWQSVNFLALEVIVILLAFMLEFLCMLMTF